MLVVAAALVRDGCVLSARRRTGGWEFPGGKVEHGEDAAAALRRECREELAVDIDALREIGACGDGRIDLRLWLARLAGGTPQALADHDELRWLDASALDSVAWLPLDRMLLDQVRPLLG